MDTKAVAELIGTSPRVLRRWLRTEGSTFTAVGSNARYDFTDRDLPTIRTRFAAWQHCTPAPATAPVAPSAPERTARVGDAKDRAVWAEEGVLPALPDIRDPRVRARVRRIAREQEDRLELQLLAVGLHITQIYAA